MKTKLQSEDETDSHIETQQESMAGSRIASMTDDELRASIVIDERQAKLWPHGSEVRKSLMDELRMLRIDRNRRLQRKRNRPQLKCIRRYKTKDQYYLVINWNEDKPLPESLELRITKRDAELLTAHGLPYSPLTY